MADNPNDKPTPNNAQSEAQGAMQKEIASLKREINKINRPLAERGEEAAEEARAGTAVRATALREPRGNSERELPRSPKLCSKTLARLVRPLCSVAFAGC